MRLVELQRKTGPGAIRGAAGAAVTAVVAVGWEGRVRVGGVDCRLGKLFFCTAVTIVVDGLGGAGRLDGGVRAARHRQMLW